MAGSLTESRMRRTWKRRSVKMWGVDVEFGRGFLFCLLAAAGFALLIAFAQPSTDGPARPFGDPAPMDPAAALAYDDLHLEMKEGKGPRSWEELDDWAREERGRPAVRDWLGDQLPRTEEGFRAARRHVLMEPEPCPVPDAVQEPESASDR
jgi:hypothetical protein